MRHCLAALIAAILTFAPAFASADAATPALDKARIAAVVTQALTDYEVPGAVLAIDTPGERWVRAFGVADWQSGRAVTVRDHFAIRSVTKSFTVTRVLQLIAASRGAITLDDPIGKYLRGIPNGDIITIRQLADMTSGLYNYTDDPDFRQAFGSDLTRHWALRELLDYALHSESHGAFNFPPGAQYQYSNTNTLLLGKLVVVLSGMPFAATLDSAILTPLHLASTAYLHGLTLPPPRATGYQGFTDNEPDPVAINATSVSFAGAMASTAADLATWGEALVDGTLLSARLQSQRFRTHPTASDPHSPAYDRYGLGMGEIAGWSGHTGSGLGFQAAVLHNIETGVTFAIVLNASNVEDSPARIFCRLLPLLDKKPAPAGSVCTRLR